MRNTVRLFALTLVLLLPAFALAQVSITTAGPAGAYSQTFNGGTFLGTSDYPLTNNAAANLGWYAFRTSGNLTPNVFDADTGTDTAGEFNNYAAGSVADRAFGSLAAAGTGTMYYGLRIQNDTGVLIRSLRVQYTGEQWRDASATADTLAFSYQVSAGDITSLTAGTWTNVTALDFITPTNTNAGAAINGNLAANRVARDWGILVDIPAGGEIMLRWADADDPGTDHGVGIDDVTVTLFIPTAAHLSIAGRAVTSDGTGIGNTRITLSGGTLPEPLQVLTNPFGYYQFDNVPAGETYLVEAFAKRHTFIEPVRVINLSEKIADLDFVASPK